MQISPELLAILACPVAECRGELNQQADRLVCGGCGRQYRIEDRWAVLIPEEAIAPAAAGAPGTGA